VHTHGNMAITSFAGCTREYVTIATLDSYGGGEREEERQIRLRRVFASLQALVAARRELERARRASAVARAEHASLRKLQRKEEEAELASAKVKVEVAAAEQRAPTEKEQTKEEKEEAEKNDATSSTREGCCMM
jgi:hypothetical protein